jgi:chemotaxis family two-component system sensor kinase Cph1
MKNPIDISQCDSEPIRFINALQSFGAIIVLDEHSKIRCFSENIFELLNIKEQKLLDEKYNPEFFPLDKFDITEKMVNNLRIIQIENHPVDHSENINSYLEKLQSSSGLKNLLDNCAGIIAELTGFDRVMIYKFHEDFHGEVVAEKVSPGVESFYGLHYPATDIPTPARAIFLENWIRIIPDVNYTPVALKSSLPEVIDLGTILVRAVSPIHISYLRNMEVGATLTISILIDNKLWGLVACHHLSARMIPKPLREKCETIGRVTSSLINVVSLKERHSYAEKVNIVHNQLITRMENSDDMARELVSHTPTLLDLISAQGASAALYMDGYWVGVGSIPTKEQLDELVDWLSKEFPGVPVWESNQLSKYFPPASAYKNIASGVLAASVPKTSRNYILWFRPEIIQSVAWAGKPEKIISENGRLTPRASFEEWRESVYGESAPWKPWELDAALELRNGILAIDLKKQFEKEQKARNEAERAKQTREDLMAVVSHDLKNPLSSLQMNIHLLKKFLPADDVKNRALVERMFRSSNTMNNLINDILSIAKLESGQMDLQTTEDPINKVIDETIEMLSPMALDKHIDLQNTSTLHCHVAYDYDRIMQVLSNLIGNAIKFTPEYGKITVSIETCGPEFVKIKVSDTGPGIPKEDSPNVFDRFWQAHQAKRMGTGLGLSIAKGIIETHGGEIWVESVPGEGATFQFTLPIVRK